MKNKLKITAIIFIAILITIGVTAYIYRKQIVAHFVPAVEQIGDIFINVKNDTTFISSKLALKNKSLFKIKIDSIKYQVSLFDKVYLKSQKFVGLDLLANDEDTIDFALKIPYLTILKDLKVERKKADSANYSINVSLLYSTVFGKIEIPINHSAKLKIPQPPEINIVDIKYDILRMNHIIADVKIEVINHSDVELSINDIKYKMSVLNRGNIDGNFKKVINIKPNGKTIVIVPIEIIIKHIGKIIYEVIFNKDQYDYTLTLDALVESTAPFKQSFQLRITKNGTMELKK